MDDGRAIVESSTPEGIIALIYGLRYGFHYVSATEPIKTPEGRFISSVRYSNDTTIVEVRPVCG